MLDLNVKHQKALQWLTFQFGSQATTWDADRCFAFMQQQGFTWLDPPGSWFLKFAIPDNDPVEAGIRVWGDTPTGPFHWRVKCGDQVNQGDATTAAVAIQTAATIADQMKRTGVTPVRD